MPAYDTRIAEIERALLKAHAGHDTGLLAELYCEAAGLKHDLGDVDAAAFYMTHAYVFALEGGREVAEKAHRFLINLGREV